MRLPILCVTFALGAMCPGPASAVVLTVGSEAGCNHATVQDAVDALPAGGIHEIRIRTGSYAAQAIKIAARELTLRGGYASCAATASSGSSTLSGQGGGADSVVQITGDDNEVTLENLAIIRGDEVADGYGGGIDFRGNGYLVLRETGVAQNEAGYGGGISLTGTGGSAELRLESGTVVQFNTARVSRGGIRIDGNARLVAVQDRIGIYNNEAVDGDGGFGGGVLVVGPARADLGSPGVGASGMIAFNRARYGGGIAAVAGEEDGRDVLLRVFTTDAQRPFRLHDNLALQTGGALYLKPYRSLTQIVDATLYAFDYRIEDNVAQNGSAIYGDLGNSGAPYYFKHGSEVFLEPRVNDTRPLERGAVPCAAGIPCREVSGNATRTDAGAPTDGATILIQTDSLARFREATLRANRGGRLLHALDSNFTVENSLLVDNTMSLDLVSHAEQDDFTSARIAFSTIAGNQVGAGHVISKVNDLTIERSILWQPGKLLLQDLGGSTSPSYLLVNEVASLGGPGSSLVVFDPRFVDPSVGDYRVRAASPAVDFAPPPATGPGSTPTAFDLDGAARAVDLAAIPDFLGHVDVGAYERPALQPLVLNGGFDRDVRHWVEAAAGVSSRDPAQDAQGDPASGALRIRQDDPPQPNVFARVQCLHLPAPGRYRLNGWGRSSGPIGLRDSVFLRWELRHDGGAACLAGMADLSGDHGLSASAGWIQPAAAALIDAPVAIWTPYSSVSVLLAVRDVGVTFPTSALGWIDGVALELEGDVPPSGLPFRDGFEQ